MSDQTQTDPEKSSLSEPLDTTPAPAEELAPDNGESADKDQGAANNEQKETKAEKPPSAVSKLVDKWSKEEKATPEAEKPAEDDAEKPADTKQEEKTEEKKTPESDEPLAKDPAVTKAAQTRIHELANAVRDNKPFTDLGRDLFSACQQVGLKASEFRAWSNVGMAIHAGKATDEHKAVIREIANDLGLLPTATAPDVSKVKTLIEALEKDEHLTPEARRKLLEAVETVATPPKAEEKKAPERKAPEGPDPRVAAQHDAAAIRSQARIDAYFDSIESKYGSTIWDQVGEKMQTEMAAVRKLHPDAWPAEVATRMARLIAARPATTKPVTKTLTPSKTTSSSTPVFKSERERLLAKHSA